MTLPRCLIPVLVTLLASTTTLAADLAIEGSADPVEHGKASTGDASPVDPGVLETEATYAPVFSGGALGAGPLAYTHAWALTATYGVLPGVDVKLGGAVASTYDATRSGADAGPRSGSGLGDVTVGTRWRFVNVPERALELAAVLQATLPVGARGSATQLGISQGYWSGRFALVGTKDVGRLTMNAELACTAPLAGDARGLLAVAQANAAAGYHVRRWLQPELEVNYQSSFGIDAHVLAVTAGVVVPWGSGQRLVAAVQRSVAAWNSPASTGALLAYKTSL